MPNEILNSVLAIVIAYLLGSIPSAVWISRWVKRIDIREHGSKNAGLTNVFRVLGWKPALPVVVLDLGKGILAVWIGYRLVPGSQWAPLLCGVMVILGHSFTCMAGFRGGKGVLTALGVFLMLAPDQALLSFAVWLAVTFSTRYVSLGSILACVTLGISLTWSMFHAGLHWNLVVVGWAVALFVIVKHRANMVRLLHGTENRFGKKKETA